MRRHKTAETANASRSGGKAPKKRAAPHAQSRDRHAKAGDADADAPDVREEALLSLMRILEEGDFTAEVIAQTYAASPQWEDRDRAFYTRLVEGTLEHQIRIDWYLDHISSTPVRKMKPLIRALLRMSAYQILFLDRVPDHAAVSEALRIAQRHGFANLKGFVNGVLRNLARQKDEIALPDPCTQTVRYLSVCYSSPEWIVQMWLDRYGRRETERMLRAFTADQRICLWANPCCASLKKSGGSREDAGADGKNPDPADEEEHAEDLWDRGDEAACTGQLRDLLAQEGFDAAPYAAEPQTRLPALLTCGRMRRISESVCFREGAFYIQDFSSVMAVIPALAQMQEKTSPLTVIDVCASPGGKSLYLASHLPDSVHFICRDISESKVRKIEENAARLHLTNIDAQIQDACVLRPEDIGTADLLIADLPCSGLGVLARKADMRSRVKESDIASLAALQRRILTTVSAYVKPGGFLLYSTCTVSEQENEAQAAWIPAHLPFEASALRGLSVRSLGEGVRAGEGYLQILPQDAPYRDGFFIALFRRKAQP